MIDQKISQKRERDTNISIFLEAVLISFLTDVHEEVPGVPIAVMDDPRPVMEMLETWEMEKSYEQDAA